MPIYEFKCEKCELKFEKYYSKISDNKKEECPSCGGVGNRVVSLTNFKMGDSVKVAKEVDLAVGKDAERRWKVIEERNSKKEKLRQEFGTEKLSRDFDGNYTPLTVTKDDKVVTEKEGVKLRKEMYKKFNEVVKDPKTKVVDSKE